MQKTFKYLYNLSRPSAKPGLETITKLAESIGNPQSSYKTIHVAGTNGKGSVCVFLASVLEKAGYKVGLYTSPPLVKFNERIKISGKQISDREIAEHAKFLKLKSGEIGIRPTFFEFTTAMAFLHFAREKVDAAVIETGMGGRLDATNPINPILSVITNIDFDHIKYLGDTKEKIAEEKAGIIKSAPLVTGERNAKILGVFRKVCEGKHTKLITMQNIKTKLIESDLKKQVFEIDGKRFTIGLLGLYQVENACTAYLALSCLKGFFKIPNKAIECGFREAKWSGRLDIISKDPLIIADGTHNIAGLKATYDFVKRLPQRKVLVLGISKDKPYG